MQSVSVIGVVVAALTAGSGASPSGTERPSPSIRLDPATIVTVDGVVEAVQRVDNPRRQGEHVSLRTCNGIVVVHLGPCAYLDKHGFKLERGDRVSLTGSRVTVAGHVEIVAQVISNRGSTLVLRDTSGVPVWLTSR